MEDCDLWRLAAMLIQKYGEGAEMYACLRADEAMENSNNRASDTWKRVAVAVSDLEEQTAQTQSIH
jgi:hypothetical protein